VIAPRMIVVDGENRFVGWLAGAPPDAASGEETMRPANELP
jgi:hypothetical protein